VNAAYLFLTLDENLTLQGSSHRYLRWHPSNKRLVNDLVITHATGEQFLPEVGENGGLSHNPEFRGWTS
jgi:hypothetical protein